MATENQGNDLVVQIGGDVSGFEAAADSAVKHLDDLEKKVEGTTQEIDKKTAALAKADAKYTEQLKTRYDPVYAAQKRYVAELENIRRAEQLGALNAEQTEAAMQRAFAQRTAAVQRVIGANQALITSNAQAAASGRAFGASMQNAAFQVGDFFVQVASGSGVLRPLIQQGSQFASIFGPWGAILGAAGAAAGALATAFLSLEDGTKDAEKAQQDYNRALEQYADITMSAEDIAKRRKATLIEETRETLIAAAAVKEKTAAELEADRAYVSRLRGSRRTNVGDQELGALEGQLGIEQSVAEIQAAEDRTKVNLLLLKRDLDRYFADSDAGLKQQTAGIEARTEAERDGIQATAQAQKEADDARMKAAKAAADDLNRWLDGQQEALKAQGEAIKLATESERVEAEKADKFEAYLQSVERENELLGLSADQRRLQLALIEAQQRKGEALTDAERRRVEAAQQVGEAYRRQQQVAEELERSFERAFDRIGSAITTMFVEGKASALDFRNVALAVVGEIAQEFIKLATINPLKNALFGTNSPTLGSGGGLFSGLGNLFGGGGGGFGTGSGFGNMDYGMFFHGGGIVGADRVRMSPVANDTFSSAPRFHSGLMPDEFPAILQKGEGVFTPAQMKALGGSKIEIIDQRGMNAPPIEQEVMTDGRVRLLIREAAPSIVKASVSEMENRQRRGQRA